MLFACYHLPLLPIYRYAIHNSGKSLSVKKVFDVHASNKYFFSFWKNPRILLSKYTSVIEICRTVTVVSVLKPIITSVFCSSFCCNKPNHLRLVLLIIDLALLSKERPWRTSEPYPMLPSWITFEGYLATQLAGTNKDVFSCDQLTNN